MILDDEMADDDDRPDVPAEIINFIAAGDNSQAAVEAWSDRYPGCRQEFADAAYNMRIVGLDPDRSQARHLPAAGPKP
jgi:hypothetical protein